MKRFAVISATFLSLLLAFAIPVCAQQEERDKPEQQEEKRDPDAKPPKQEEKQVQQEERHEQQQEKKVEQKAERSADHAGRIPEDHFRAHFGHEHTFVINRVTVVNGSPRFHYGGYWFVIADPWPAGWYYTDSCYIDFIDGEYFLFNLAHPGIRVGISVVL
jgi:flagellar motor protein MotB